MEFTEASKAAPPGLPPGLRRREEENPPAPGEEQDKVTTMIMDECTYIRICVMMDICTYTYVQQYM